MESREMIAGTVSGITYLSDRMRITLEDGPKTVFVEVYPTELAFLVRLDGYIWTQAGKAMYTAFDRSISDGQLYLIREDDQGVFEEVKGRKRSPTS